MKSNESAGTTDRRVGAHSPADAYGKVDVPQAYFFRRHVDDPGERFLLRDHDAAEILPRDDHE
jgi:hypothetical protein